MTSYNLLDQPWIPVVHMATQRVHHLSLLEVCKQADAYSAFATISPLTSVVLTRLILAFQHRAQGDIAQYAARWHERFDLLHPDFPFGQISALQVYSKARKAPSVLSIWRASDRNRSTLYDQTRMDAELSMSEAVLGLLTLQGYMTGGLTSYDTIEHKAAIASPLVNVGIWICRERSLADMFARYLKIFPYIPHDLPSWEQPPALVPEVCMPVGIASWYSWQSRRILLFPNTLGNAIASVILMKGNTYPKESNPWLIDPMVATKEGQPLNPRGTSPFLSLSAITQLPTIQPDRMNLLQVISVVTDKAKYVTWQSRSYAMPGILTSDKGKAVLEEAEYLAQQGVRLFKKGVVKLPDGRELNPLLKYQQLAFSPSHEEVNAPDRYWSAIDDETILWLDQLNQSTLEHAIEDWRTIVFTLASRSWSVMIAVLPYEDEQIASITALEEEGIAVLHWYLHQPQQKEETTHDATNND